jgi:hypothetical protein
MIAKIIMISVVMFIERICSLYTLDCRVKFAGLDACPARLPAKIAGKILQMFTTIYGDF